VQVHQRLQRAASRNAGSNRARTQPSDRDSTVSAVLSRKSAKNHEVRVEIFRDMKHGRMASLEERDQAAPFQLDEPPA